MFLFYAVAIYTLYLVPLSCLTHVLKEKTTLSHYSKHFSYVSETEKSHKHTVVFAVAQQNIGKLTDVLQDVSDPSSANYGKHWTKQAIIEYTSNTESRQIILSYLRSIKSVEIKKESQHENYIVVTAPIYAWEHMFMTTFHNYEIVGQKKSSKKYVSRAKEYWIPIELSAHVTAVFNTVQFPFPNTNSHNYDPRKMVSQTSYADETIPGYVTPALIKKYYSVSNDIGSMKVTQAVYELVREEQVLLIYCPFSVDST